MEVKRPVAHFVFNDFAENTYLLYVPGGEAYIIDPGCCNEQEFDELRSFIETAGCVPKGIIATHAHLDHLFGVQRCRRQWGIPLLLHPGDNALLESAPRMAQAWGFPLEPIAAADGTLRDGQTLTLGEHTIEVIHTPGHSAGGVCLLIGGKRPTLIAGDTLFDGSIGRADLPGGNYVQLIHSIKLRLLPLPDETVVLPGHGPQTTIGKERLSNPFLQG